MRSTGSASSPPGQQRPTVAQCLALKPLSAGTVVAGGAAAATRSVSWIAVIEWPVEDFVAAGELIMTTGVGCDAAMLARMVAEIAAAGAAAVCVAVGPGAPFPELPPAVVRVGDETGVPLVALPWEVRFADVTRVVVDRLLSARYAALDGRGRLPADFTDALLQRDALGAIAAALEEQVQRPVLVYDAGLVLSAAGARARAALGEDALAAQPAAARALAPARVVELRDRLGAADVSHAGAIPELLLGDGALVAPAHAEGGVVGYIAVDGGVALDAELVVERQALEQAAVATAIEMLRHRAAAQAEAAARGDFLWELAGAEPADRARLVDKAALLGYDRDRRYRVLVAVVERAVPADDDRAALDELVYHLRRQGGAEGVQAVARGRRLLAVVPESAPPELAPARLAERLEGSFGRGLLTWGTDDGAQALVDLADGVRRAEQAIAVGRALHGAGGVHDAEALAPFMLLQGLAADAAARAEVTRLLEPILAYDRNTARDLLLTLTVYLEEHGNTSSAARRLHLNRHSLLYRLRKIETLTGRSLDRHEDRFLLDLGLRVHRMTAG